MLVANASYAFALGAFLINIRNTDINSKIEEIVVIYDGDFDIEGLNKIDNRLKFVRYTLNDWCTELSDRKEFGYNEKAIKRYSHLTFAKHKIFELLEESERVIYSDLDILLRGNLAELAEIDADILWRDGAKFVDKFARAQKGAPLLDINCDKDTPAPNGGLIVVRDSIDYKKAYNEAVSYMRRYIPYMTATVDEQIFAYVAVKMKLNQKTLSKYRYNVLPHFCRSESRLIHFMGAAKPWNDLMLQALFPDWRNNYEIFNALTDGKYHSDKICFDDFSIGKLVQKNINLDRWERLFRENYLILPKDLHIDTVFSSHNLRLNFDSDVYFEILYIGGVESTVCRVCVNIKKLNIVTEAFYEELKKIEGIESSDACGGFLKLYSKKIRVWQLNELFEHLHKQTEKVRLLSSIVNRE